MTSKHEHDDIIVNAGVTLKNTSLSAVQGHVAVLNNEDFLNLQPLLSDR